MNEVLMIILTVAIVVLGFYSVGITILYLNYIRLVGKYGLINKPKRRNKDGSM